MQIPTRLLVNLFADFVFVTSVPDSGKFTRRLRDSHSIIVVQGGVEDTEAKKYMQSNKVVPVALRKYDSCFLGRFHHQKGVLELIEIWQLVVKKIPTAKLIMIGDGELRPQVEELIKNRSMNDNIELAGYKYGVEKFEYFKQSKIVLHPATFDSGGMAAAEAMVWGIPGVAFDLEALETYYPKGMVKVKCFDLSEFANTINKLLTDAVYYSRIKEDALEMIRTQWLWSMRTKDIFHKVFDETK
jgi:glycosyltransferase involved in cell wall biosynthesis